MWLNVADDHSRRLGSVLISAWLGSRLETITTTTGPVAMPQPVPSPPVPFNTFSSYPTASPSQPQGQLPVTAWEAYDCLLAAAIHAEGRGCRKLVIKGDWKWLLAQFASTCGVRSTYAALAYLAWVVRADVISCSSDCLQLLTQGLKPLKAAQAQGGLLPEEAALLRAVEEAALTLLARCFEKYYAVSDQAATGILDGDIAATESPAPVLRHAVLLAEVLSEWLKPSMHLWMIDCFEVAAAHRFEALSIACDRAVTECTGASLRGPVHTALFPSSDNDPLRQSHTLSQDVDAIIYEADMGQSGQDFLASYAQLEGLCQAMMSELASDRGLHDSGILPEGVYLPQTTAAQYCKLLLGKLRRVMEGAPPPTPSSAAINLMIGVGNIQAYLEWEGLTPPPGTPPTIHAYKIFLPYVQQWIDGSQAKLLQTCQALEGRGVGPMSYVGGEETGHGIISPLLAEMLHHDQIEFQRYERLVNYWPVYAPRLEAAICTVLRAVTAAVTCQYGLMAARTAASFNRRPAKRFPERQVFHWQQPSQLAASPLSPQPQRAPTNSHTMQRILPFEAVLLNSLRRLLTFVPQTNDLLTSWERTTADSPGRERALSPAPSPTKGEDDAALRGALFDQLVKELRSEYAAAVTACAQRIHKAPWLRTGTASNQRWTALV
ncbi:hypothetical protein ABBQ32_002897 [Trebouxia sp. C0010 RCD-2024]